MGKKYCVFLYFYGNYHSFAAQRKLPEIREVFFWDAFDNSGGNTGAVCVWQGGCVDEKDQSGRIFQELDNLKLDTKHLEQTQKKAYVQEYERAIEMDVERIAEGRQLQVLWTKVHLSEEYQVESIGMEVALEGENGISIPKVSFGDDSQKHPEVYALKQELMEFYRLEETQIQIAVRGG